MPLFALNYAINMGFYSVPTLQHQIFRKFSENHLGGFPN